MVFKTFACPAKQTKVSIVVMRVLGIMKIVLCLTILVIVFCYIYAQIVKMFQQKALIVLKAYKKMLQSRPEGN